MGGNPWCCCPPETDGRVPVPDPDDGDVPDGCEDT